MVRFFSFFFFFGIVCKKIVTFLSTWGGGGLRAWQNGGSDVDHHCAFLVHTLFLSSL